MTYSLGIDVGATTCAAAVRSDAGLEPCDLGDRTATMPAVALPRGDGTALVGEEADRVSPYEPALVARMVTMGLLDAEPVAIDGVPCHPLPLTEALLDAVIERAAQPDERPEHVMVAYPLREGGGPERLLAEAAHRVTGGAAVLVPAPIAAAAKLAHDRDLGPDMLVVVVDFGGTSVDITLVRCTPEVFDLVGDPTSLTDLGGVDLDAEVVSLVESAIGDVTSTVGPDDRAGMLALRRMRASCRAAKERLSIDDAAIVDVAIPQARAQIEITRDAFERTIFPRLDGAVDTVLATIEDAGLLPADLGLALVTGGSAHIPLFAGLMAERTGLTVVVDDEPQLTVAMGAALFADVADLMPGIAQVPTPAPAPRESHPADPPAPPAPEPQPLPQPPVDQPYAAGPPLDPAPPEPPPPPRSMPVPPLRTGELWPAAIDAGWTPDGVGWASDDDWQPEPDDVWPNTAHQWEDSRTSVFEPPPTAAPPPLPPPAPPVGDHDQFQRLTTSDTDPFGSRSSSLVAARRRERDDDWADDDEDDRAGVDLRVVVGGAVAAVFLVVLAGFAVLSGAGGDSGPIAVADTVATTTSSTTEPTGADTAALTNSSTTSSTSSTSTSTTEAPQDEPATTSPPEPEPDPDPGPPPPPPPPPPTAPPTTRPRPTTTSTTSTSTTSTSTTSTSTVPQAGT